MNNIISTNYVDDKPLQKVSLTINNRTISCNSYLDTGCTDSIVLTQPDIKKFGIQLGNSISRYPSRVMLGDGTYVGIYYYEAIIEYDGQKRSTTIGVIHPKIKIKLPKDEQRKLEKEPVEALLGRGIMDEYSVTFNGLSNPKQFKFDK